MTDPVELFAKLAIDLEDIHALSVEGQCADQPPEVLLILAGQICNGLHRSVTTVRRIENSLGAL